MKKTILFFTVILFAVSIAFAQEDGFPGCTGNYVAHCIDITNPTDCLNHFSNPEGFGQCRWVPANGEAAGCYPNWDQPCEPRSCTLWHEFGDVFPNQYGNGPWEFVDSCEGENCNVMIENFAITQCLNGCSNGACIQQSGAEIPEFSATTVIAVIAVIVIVAFAFIRKR